MLMLCLSNFWSQDNFWKKHVDKHFAMAVVKQADELAEMFPEDMIFCISQDDKIKVPLRLIISKK